MHGKQISQRKPKLVTMLQNGEAPTLLFLKIRCTYLSSHTNTAYQEFQKPISLTLCTSPLSYYSPPQNSQTVSLLFSSDVTYFSFYPKKWSTFTTVMVPNTTLSAEVFISVTMNGARKVNLKYDTQPKFQRKTVKILVQLLDKFSTSFNDVN